MAICSFHCLKVIWFPQTLPLKIEEVVVFEGSDGSGLGLFDCGGEGEPLLFGVWVMDIL